MSDNLITAIVSIVLAIIGLAALATVLSGNARTSQVIGAASGGLATDLAAATGPVTGQSVGGFGGVGAATGMFGGGNFNVAGGNGF